MLPTICAIENIERIRDGGSLAATLESEDGKRYILFIKKDVRYNQPVLIDCDPTKRPLDTERIRYSELSGPYISISWNQARELLEKLSSSFTFSAKRSNPFRREWMQDMLDVVSRNVLER
jgi:hypothetical protein